MNHNCSHYSSERGEKEKLVASSLWRKRYCCCGTVLEGLHPFQDANRWLVYSQFRVNALSGMDGNRLRIILKSFRVFQSGADVEHHV